MKNGKGIETFKDGKYIGNWIEGKIDGDGYYKMNNGSMEKQSNQIQNLQMRS